MLDPVKVAVIVPAYNAAATLADCLNGLIVQQTFGGLELLIIVVDDGSSDATARLAAEYGDCGVTLVQTLHRGAAAARNAGFKAAPPDCKIILFTDADCVPAPDWAGQMVMALQASPPTVAGVKGIYRTKQKSRVARFAQTEYEERYRRFAAGLAPEFADTYAAAFRYEILLNFPFDERLPKAIVEDAELGWRIRRAGYSFGFAPKAIVYHRHAATVKAYLRRKFQIGRWRLKLYRAYPAKISSDNHTSQSAKLQMAFLGLTAVCALAALAGWLTQKRTAVRPNSKLATAVRRGGGAGTAVFGISLELSYLPFIRRVWEHDHPLTAAAWLMLNLRTAAYTAGAIAGLVETVIGGR